jgi:hypothetical protein
LLQPEQAGDHRQVRGRCNRLPTEGELTLLASWSEAGGQALSYWMKA